MQWVVIETPHALLHFIKRLGPHCKKNVKNIIFSWKYFAVIAK